MAISNSTDRFNGLVAGLAIKAPVATETVANITLSGLQTINGVVLTEGDRVLVKDQTNQVENGIYEASTSAWKRAADWDGSRDATNGTLVVVGRSAMVALWQMQTAADPFLPGTDTCTFTELIYADLGLQLGSNNPNEGASLVGIEDAGSIIVATDVEGALQELAGGINTNAGAIATNAGDIATLQATAAGQFKFRSSDLTVTNDVNAPETQLTGFTVERGKLYTIEAYLSCTQAGAGGGGLRISFSGTLPVDDRAYSGWAVSEAGVVAQDHDNAGVDILIAPGSIGAGDHSVHIKGFVYFSAGTGTGTYDLNWGQNVSSADATTVKRGSWVSLRQLN
jgi:hypothetical protein